MPLGQNQLSGDEICTAATEGITTLAAAVNFGGLRPESADVFETLPASRATVRGCAQRAVSSVRDMIGNSLLC
jgi:hypothetical protein